MADLSANEIIDIRKQIGDTDTSDPYLSDTYLEYLFDNRAGSDVDKTIVWALRALLGIASRGVSQSNARTGDSKSYNQWYNQLEQRLKDWESRNGLQPTATISYLNLGIDEETSDVNIT
jgi:hypothetical protein